MQLVFLFYFYFIFIPIDLIQFIDAVLPAFLDNNIDVWVSEKSCSLQSVSTLLDKVELASEEKPQVDFPLPNLTSNFLFIFTSGTTGTAQLLFLRSWVEKVVSGGLGLWNFAYRNVFGQVEK